MEKSMKKRTLFIWLIILGFLALVIFQNQAFFLKSKTAISLNFGLGQTFQAPELPNAVIFLIFFVFGLIVAYLFSLSVRFKARRSIKKLQATETAHLKELNKLKDEIKQLKSKDAVGPKNEDAPKVDPARPAAKAPKSDAAKGSANPAANKKEDAGGKK
jgi:uncharacterized integral membrane protein